MGQIKNIKLHIVTDIKVCLTQAHAQTVGDNKQTNKQQQQQTNMSATVEVSDGALQGGDAGTPTMTEFVEEKVSGMCQEECDARTDCVNVNNMRKCMDTCVKKYLDAYQRIGEK